MNKRCQTVCKTQVDLLISSSSTSCWQVLIIEMIHKIQAKASRGTCDNNWYFWLTSICSFKLEIWKTFLQPCLLGVDFIHTQRWTFAPVDQKTSDIMVYLPFLLGSFYPKSQCVSPLSFFATVLNLSNFQTPMGWPQRRALPVWLCIFWHTHCASIKQLWKICTIDLTIIVSQRVAVCGFDGFQTMACEPDCMNSLVLLNSSNEDVSWEH